jgi:transposase InsO family protein
VRDEQLKAEITRVWKENREVYGADKVWLELNRQGIWAARCTTERLMRGLGLHGVRRGRAVRTTTAVAAAAQQRRAEDLFQPPDLLAEARLGDEQPFRGAGEGARLGDRDEIPQMPQLQTLRCLYVRRGQPDRLRL